MAKTRLSRSTADLEGHKEVGDEDEGLKEHGEDLEGHKEVGDKGEG